MPGKRKYAGPLQPGKRSAYVPKGPAPKALRKKSVRKNYKAAYKLSKPFKQVLNKFLDSSKQTHWVTGLIRDQLVLPLPKLQNQGPNGLWELIPKVYQVGQTVTGGGEMPDNIESREGSKIKMKSLSVSLTLRMDPGWHIDDPNATAIRYKVLILTCKKQATYNQMVQAYFGTGAYEDEQFRDGAKTAKWDKYMEGFDHPVNTELFTVHDMKTGTLAHGLATGDISGSAVTTPSSIHNLILRVKCKSKTLLYEDPGATLPTNFQPFMWIGWKAYNGADWISPIATPGILHAVGSIRMSFDDLS